MSLIYYLKFKKKLTEKKELKELIENHDNKYFQISIMFTSTYSFIEGYFDKDKINLNLGSSSKIMFTVTNKDCDPILFRKSILEIIYKITEEIYPEEDYFFDFNGDYIHEKRENGIIKRNSESDFYEGIE